jgi:opacity protein-like surface antigen
MRVRAITILSLLVLLFARAGVVYAQSGAIANVGVGVSAADGSSDLAINGGVAYRFNRSIGFGIELTHMPSLDSDVPCCFALPAYIGFPADDVEGHATIFTTNVRVEIPTTMRRLIPFVVGGGGIASVTEPYPVYYAIPLTVSQAADTLGLSFPPPSIRPGPQYFSNTTISMALTLGGGVSVLATDHLAVDVDLRAIRLQGQTDRSIGRFSVGASYRF